MPDNEREHIDALNEALRETITKPIDRACKVIAPGQLLYTSVVGWVDTNSIFGVQPAVDADVFKKLVAANSNCPYSNPEAFDKHVSENVGTFWSWGNRRNSGLSTDMAVALLARCLVATENQFCARFDVAESNLASLEGAMQACGIFYDVEAEDGRKLLGIYGRLCDSQVEFLDKSWRIAGPGGRQTIVPLVAGASDKGFASAYSSLAVSRNFYNGVITNLDSLDISEPSAANKSVTSMKANISCTTYATVLGMGYPQLTSDEGHLYKSRNIKEHPLLCQYRNVLDEIDKREIELQSTLYDKLGLSSGAGQASAGDVADIESINAYLEASLYPHIISIAGNLITLDGYVILVRRGGKEEHAFTNSCSVTGYSEVNNGDVRFYEYSVDDDRPSIDPVQLQGRADASGRKLCSFAGEFVRETRAEFDVATFPGSWRYYGIIVSGKPPAGKLHEADLAALQPMTVDFEIAGEAKCDLSLMDVIELQGSAIESAEAARVFGCHFKYSHGPKSRARMRMQSILEWLNSRAGILSVWILFLISLIQQAISPSGFSWSGFFGQFLANPVSWAFAIIAILVLLIHFVQDAPARRAKFVSWADASSYRPFVQPIPRWATMCKKRYQVDLENSNYLVYTMLNLLIISRCG